jgi:hypothetical protein
MARPRLGVLVRFPGEDLYWNDLQLLNSWRWFSESMHNVGIFQTLFGVVDFRQNTGSMFAADAKWPSQYIDIGAWFTFIFNDVNLSYTLKFATYSLLCAGSIFKLIQQNRFTAGLSPMSKLVFFGILCSSLILHPVLFGEVGPLLQVYLLLIPCWFEFLKNANSRFAEDKSRSIARLIVLVLASLGSSDLFFISSISAIFITFYLYHFSSPTRLLLLFKLHLLVLGFFLLDKSYYVLNKLNDDFLVSSSGTWTPSVYWELFLKPALTKTVFYPEFVGPSTIFINILVIALGLISLRNKTSKEFHKFLSSAILVFAILCFAGFVMHSIQEIRVILPSAIRYHLTFFPFLVVSIIAAHGNLGFRNSKKQKLNNFFRKPLMVVFPLLMVILVLFSSTFTYGGKVSDYYEFTVDRNLGNWYQKSLPGCINSAVNTNPGNIPRSFMLVKKSFTENLMDDSLLIIGEQPKALDGRTFQQWRYSSGVLLNLKLLEVEKSGLFSRPFLANEPLKIMKFSHDLMVPYVLSTERLTNRAFLELGRCDFPDQFLETVMKNNTLGATIFVYFIPDWTSGASKPITRSLFSSSVATFTIDCTQLNSNKILSLPINYNPDILSTSKSEQVSTARGKDNGLELDLFEQCKDIQTLDIEVTSHSRLVGIRNSIYLILPMIFVAILLARRFWLRHHTLHRLYLSD